MTRNPVEHANLLKYQPAERKIWTADILFHAIDVCDDDLLKLAMNITFSCTLRMGEMLGLTWDCVDISEKSIQSGSAYIFINKELQRVNRDSLEKLDDRGIILKFPATIRGKNTRLVLKEPKTKTSVRRVYLPKSVAEMLIQRKKDIDELKALLGDEFLDFNLVFCGTIGRPLEANVIRRKFQKLIRDNDLPEVVFYSLRHSSITYKLKMTSGDMKAVQGDSGHARPGMITEVYSHIIDEDRRHNAELFEKEFYSTDHNEGEKTDNPETG